MLFQTGTFIECHCLKEKVLRDSKPNRWLVLPGHEDSRSAWACSADLWFQCSAFAQIIMQAAPWVPTTTIKVIGGDPPLHIQPYGWTMHWWVFNCHIVDMGSLKRWLRSPLYIWSAKLNTAKMPSLSHVQVSNLRLSLAFTKHSSYQPITIWFQQRSWLALAKGLCAEPLGREWNQYRIDSPSFALILSGSVM